MIVRPGPAFLEAGRVPGGVVLRVYRVPDCALLLERLLQTSDDLETLAERDADFIAVLTDECCLVAYDGDTGDRMKLGNIRTRMSDG